MVTLDVGTLMKSAELLKLQAKSAAEGLETTSQKTSTISPLPTP